MDVQLSLKYGHTPDGAKLLHIIQFIHAGKITKTMSIPQEIRNKIIDEAHWRATNGHGGLDQITYDNFIMAAEYGYLLQTAGEELTDKDYEQVLEDHRRLVREMDVIINGENAAQQASLCDMVAQLRTIFAGEEKEIVVEDLQEQVRNHIASDKLYDWREALTDEEISYLENLLMTFAPQFCPGSIGFETTVMPWLDRLMGEDAVKVEEEKETKQQILNRVYGREITPSIEMLRSMEQYAAQFRSQPKPVEVQGVDYWSLVGELKGTLKGILDFYNPTNDVRERLTKRIEQLEQLKP